MGKPIIIPQVEFKSLEDFISEQNNFWIHFVVLNGDTTNHYRERPCFKRYKKLNPEEERNLTESITQKSYSEANLTTETFKDDWKNMWEAYKLMTNLVFKTDRFAMRDGKADKFYLTR